MMASSAGTPCATLIGDVVGSRDADDRAALHHRLGAAVDAINADTNAGVVAPLRITVGDEYQGAFGTVGAALHASFVLRLQLLPEHDVRHGIGWGEVAVLQEEPRVEDGSGWWAARAAIDEVHAAEARAPTRTRRTAYRRADGLPARAAGPDEHAIAAALLLRDEQVSGLDERALSVLRGLVAGETQAALAESLGVSASAVSQRVRADGLAALVAAEERLREVR